MVPAASDNVDNSIDSDILNNSPYDWLNLQTDYDLDKEGTYDNNKTVDAFSCMTFVG